MQLDGLSNINTWYKYEERFKFSVPRCGSCFDDRFLRPYTVEDIKFVVTFRRNVPPLLRVTEFGRYESWND